MYAVIDGEPSPESINRLKKATSRAMSVRRILKEKLELLSTLRIENGINETLEKLEQIVRQITSPEEIYEDTAFTSELNKNYFKNLALAPIETDGVQKSIIDTKNRLKKELMGIKDKNMQNAALEKLKEAANAAGKEAAVVIGEADVALMQIDNSASPVAAVADTDLTTRIQRLETADKLLKEAADTLGAQGTLLESIGKLCNEKENPAETARTEAENKIQKRLRAVQEFWRTFGSEDQK